MPEQTEAFAVSQRLHELQPFVQLGNDITKKLAQKNSILNYLITRAKNEASQGLLTLAHADLLTEEGLKTARAAQAAIQRYDDMNTWLTEAVITADEAEEELVEIFGDELPTLIADWKEDHGPEHNQDNA